MIHKRIVKLSYPGQNHDSWSNHRIRTLPSWGELSARLTVCRGATRSSVNQLCDRCNPALGDEPPPLIVERSEMASDCNRDERGDLRHSSLISGPTPELLQRIRFQCTRCSMANTRVHPRTGWRHRQHFRNKGSFSICSISGLSHVQSQGSDGRKILRGVRSRPETENSLRPQPNCLDVQNSPIFFWPLSRSSTEC